MANVKVIEVICPAAESEVFCNLTHTIRVGHVSAEQLATAIETVALCKQLHESTGLRVKAMADWSGRRGGTLFEFNTNSEPTRLLNAMKACAILTQKG